MRPSLRDTFADLESGIDLFDELVDKLNIGLYVDRPTQGCVYASEMLLEVFGLDWESFRGFGWAGYVAPEDRERFSGMIEEYERTLQPFEITYRILPPPGGERWIHVRSRALLDQEGRHLATLCTVEDVTDAREKAQQTAHRQKLEAIGQLSARIAHDFNNLLAAMLIATDTLERQVEDPVASECVTAIGSAIDRAVQVTDQLLTLSRRGATKTGQCVVDDEVFRLVPLLERTLGEGLRFDVALGAKGRRVPMDAGHLSQVLLNLASNASDAMQGTGRLSIRTTLIDSKWVRLEVEDEGAGMAPAVVARVFEPFYTTKDVGRGTGLGLAIVADLVGQAGGKTTVRSAPGEGTTMGLDLPVLDAGSLATHGPSSPTVVAARVPARLLVVEDNDALRQSLGYALALRGHKVRIARNLTDARQVLAEDAAIEAIVADVLLPDGSGMDLVQELRARDAAFPVVLTSGFVGENKRLEIVIDERTRFLAKPFRPSALLALLDELLSPSLDPEPHAPPVGGTMLLR